MTWDWSDDDRVALQRFLEEHGICRGRVTTKRIGDGHSNLTFAVSDGQRTVVVRRGPVPPIPPNAHDMLREARLLTALAGTEVPVPEVLAVSPGGEVIDVPFYVMTHLPGEIITEATPAALSTPDDRRRIGEALIDTLAAIHAVDWRGVGLGDIGRPEDFNRRHIERMSRLIADGTGDEPLAFQPLTSWLRQHAPPESGAAVLHNDYRIGNVMFAADRPVRVVGVLDWELATVGDPLFDVGYFLASYPEPGQPITPTTAFGTAVLEPGYPTRQELADRYQARTGRDLGSLTWYMALSLWKLAVLYEYGRRRADAGRGDRYYGDPALVRSFLAEAHRLVGLVAPPDR